MKNNKTVEKMAMKAPPLFHEFINDLEENQGLNSGTIHNRKGPLIQFFKSHRWLKSSKNVRRLKAYQIQKYVRRKSQNLSVENKRMMLTSLRTFFRFLFFKGYHFVDLSCAVPNIVTYARAKTPRALPVSLVKKLLNVPDCRRAIGRRDYAILLLFLKYGVRRKQVTELLLKDINWREGTIYFRPMKGGKPVLVPMDAEVASALLEHIKKDRRDTTYPHVFVKHQTGPTNGQPLGRALWFMVSRHLKTAGLADNHKYRGPHALRHTVATELLKNKEPLKTIADLLGHRSVSTTAIYTKVDIDQLRKLEKQWAS